MKLLVELSYDTGQIGLGLSSWLRQKWKQCCLCYSAELGRKHQPIQIFHIGAQLMAQRTALKYLHCQTLRVAGLALSDMSEAQLGSRLFWCTCASVG